MPLAEYARYDYAYKTQGWTVQNPTVGYGLDTYVAPGLPSDVSRVTVYGKFMDPNGLPLQGVARLRTNKPLVHSPSGTRVMPGVQVLRFNKGTFTMVLPATDDAQLTPGFTYQMELTVAGYKETFEFALPATPDPVNVLDLMEPQTVTAVPTSGITIEDNTANDGVVLGSDPQKLSVRLVLGADFITSLDSTEPWDDYATDVYLLFANGKRWDALLNGKTADFDVDKVRVAEIPNGTGVSLHVNDGTRESVWAVGKAKIVANAT